MKAFTKLTAVLFSIMSDKDNVMPLAKRQQQARIDWTHTYSPNHGWRGIHHRSQAKKRLIARRRRT